VCKARPSAGRAGNSARQPAWLGAEELQVRELTLLSTCQRIDVYACPMAVGRKVAVSARAPDRITVAATALSPVRLRRA